MSSASVEPTVVARSAGTPEPAGTSAGSAFDDAAAAAFADEAAEAYDEKVPIWVKIALPAGLVGIVLVSFALGKYSVSPAELVDGIVRHFQGQTLAGDDLSLDKVIFKNAERSKLDPKSEGVAGFSRFMKRYSACLPVEKAATQCLK